MTRARSILMRPAPTPAEYLVSRAITKENFGVTYVRWPYDPAVSPGGAFTSQNPSIWQTELDDRIGWIRSFDPNLYGRHQGGSFVEVGMSAEGSSKPYGRIEGGTWYQGMLRSNGTYDGSKLDLVLAAAKAKNLKLLMMIGAQGAYFDATNNRYIEYPLPTGEFWSTNRVAFSNRFRDFMSWFLDRCGNDLAAVEIANEPHQLVRLNTVVGPGYTEQLAVLVRITKQLVRRKGLSVLVCSPPMQGGETGEITAFLTTTAKGIEIDGADGTNTTGKDWIDVVCHHNYGNFADRGGGGSTTTMDAAGIDDPDADLAYPNNTTFADMYTKAVNVKNACRLGGWTGRLWNSEFHVTGVVTDTLWYPRRMTSAGFNRIFAQMLHSSFIGGYEKCFVYAADHPTLGFFDDVGTVPEGEPSTWYFKAADNTRRGAIALAGAIDLLRGQYVGGRSGTNPFYSRNGARIRLSSSSTAGVFSELT